VSGPGRGERRREALLEAAADLLVEQGIGALSHRGVAARAGLPLAATTYYFSSRDDLTVQALQRAADRWARASEALVGALPARLPRRRAVELVLAVVTAGSGRDGLFVLYERYLEAARAELLQPVVAGLDDGVVALLREVLRRARVPDDEPTARLVLATADGLLLHALAAGADDPVGAAAGPLERLLASLAEP
jgi:DNA-binding transcriptional regulator YbjK